LSDVLAPSVSPNHVIRLVAGDDNPALIVQLWDDIADEPVDLSLSTTTVKFRFRARGATTILFVATMSKVDGGFIGLAQLDWPSTGLDIAAGQYEGEVSVEFDGAIQTVRKPLRFQVTEDFAESA